MENLRYLSAAYKALTPEEKEALSLRAQEAKWTTRNGRVKLNTTWHQFCRENKDNTQLFQKMAASEAAQKNEGLDVLLTGVVVHHLTEGGKEECLDAISIIAHYPNVAKNIVKILGPECQCEA